MKFDLTHEVNTCDNKSSKWWLHYNHRPLPTSIALLKLTKPVKSHERQNPLFTRLRVKN